MSKPLIIAALALGGCAVFVLLLIKRSPSGQEDEKGFHFGPGEKPPESDTAKKAAETIPVPAKQQGAFRVR